MRKRLIPLVICGPLVALATACTPRQFAQWEQWHSNDPAEATAFANRPEVQQLIKLDTNQNGVIEPDSTPGPVKKAPSKPKATQPKSTTASNSAPRTGASGVNWDAVARCESGGQWSHPPVTNSFGTFSGGLMIMNSAWRQYGGTQFAPYAGAASKAQQIIVAERIAARVGAARAWQCPTPHL